MRDSVQFRKPLLSVVIPVKYNSGTLKYTLQTALNQDYTNLQVVISNNSMQTEVKNLIDEFSDSRLKYICPKDLMNFSGDWEFALDAADGDYVTFLGDDDGILPGALSYAMKSITFNNVDAFTWRKLNYNWPNHIIKDERNLVTGNSEQQLVKIDAKKALKLLAYFKFRYNELPCIYNSIVHKKAIESIKAQSEGGKFFSGVIPDVYSSIVLASEIKKYLFATFPLTINGASEKSSGVMQGLKKINLEQKNLISDVLNSGERYHKDIGPFSSSIASIVLGEYLLAKSIKFGFNGPDPSWLSYVNYLVYEARSSDNPQRILAAAEYTTKARKLPSLVFIASSVKKKKRYCYFTIF